MKGKRTKSIRSAFRSIVNKLRGKPKAPKAPPRAKIGETHRGVAAGSWEYRRQRIAEGQRPFEQEEIENWKPNITEEEGEGFLNDEQLVFVHSSNVVSAQFFPKVNKMMVEFGKSGGSVSAYLYDNVTMEEAKEFLQSPSKGQFIWDTFRIRGTKDGHKKTYTRIK